MENKEFVIKGYSKKELGLIYFPKCGNPFSAWRRLKRLLLSDDILVSKLDMTSYRFNSQKWLSEKMVKTIIEHIGLP